MTNSRPPLYRCRVSISVLAAGAALLSLAYGGSSVATDLPLAHHKDISVTGSTTDPDDTVGRLDMARVHDRVSQIDRRHVALTYRVRTFAPFASQVLDARRRNFVLELNRDTERGSERNVAVSSHDGRLVAEVISNATRQVMTTVTASRPNDQTIRISGPRRVLGARSYFWTSSFHDRRSRRCGQGDGFPITCQDTVPQRGWIRLDSPAWPHEH